MASYIELQDFSDLESILNFALFKSLEITDTSLGNVQLMDWRLGYLTIEAQCGFKDDFLEFFSQVRPKTGSACGRAIRERNSIIIKDVNVDQEFTPYREIAARACFRAVQSTPIISNNGAFIGVLSTHFPAIHGPTEKEMLELKTLGEITADAIIQKINIENAIQEIEQTCKTYEQARNYYKTLPRSLFTIHI
jgi:GAF domain-containing protein